MAETLKLTSSFHNVAIFKIFLPCNEIKISVLFKTLSVVSFVHGSTVLCGEVDCIFSLLDGDSVKHEERCD